ncbi:hypothetical protein [Candidatus Mesenet endosymbiont of Agriotes lineatus]|uniref:hypothetical protein n=1 Tax=Candidatus Mesenet endosymbiont of Agriotes lineatus TaxID=3077948 RepID=UPI0030D0DB08
MKYGVLLAKRQIRRGFGWVATRQIIGAHIGNRGTEDAIKLFKSIPEMYSREGIFIADKLDSYAAIFSTSWQRFWIYKPH